MLSAEREEGGRQRRKESDLHGARDMLRLVADPQLSHLVVSCCQHLATVCTHTQVVHNTLTHRWNIQYTHQREQLPTAAAAFLYLQTEDHKQIPSLKTTLKVQLKCPGDMFTEEPW